MSSSPPVSSCAARRNGSSGGRPATRRAASMAAWPPVGPKRCSQIPMCGNSHRALVALREAGAPVTAVDILPDPAIRQELQAISGWPTIPQVFVKGELIGGADITQELGESGELAKILADKLGPEY